VLGPLNRFVFVASTVRMQNSSGAVSPAARAIASSAPLTIPPTAAGSTSYYHFNETSRSQAAFAHGIYDLSDYVDGLKFTGGYRYTWDHITDEERATTGVDAITRNAASRDVASYVSTARFGRSLKISSSRSIEVRTGGSGLGCGGRCSNNACGVSAMQTYPARRAI